MADYGREGIGGGPGEEGVVAGSGDTVLPDGEYPNR